ncbi:MAG: MarR family transcriptional regulator [Candidatus Omnitrophica bacterium]|nr:MarR family transcriptional regulator [Candidatus Omnitrophota bacterium]
MNKKKEFTRHFREIQVNFSRFYAKVLTRADLTLPQYALLSQILTQGTIPMSSASRQLSISKPAVTNLVDRLEKSKCLLRVPHPEDRRVHLLKITTKGKRIVRKTQVRVLEVLLKTLDQFESKDQKIILSFYGLLSKHIRQALILSKPRVR